jgi:hypothetical protein
MTEPTRTPYCTKVRYGISGAPILTEDEMDGTFAPGVGVEPTLIELVYHAPRDDKPASVSASVTGDWTRYGERDGGQVETHFRSGPDGWPAWLAEEARRHDPDAVSAGVSPATDQAALRERIAEALLDYLSRTADIRPGRDGALAFMPEVTDDERLRIADTLAAVLPADSGRADRATVLEEAAGIAEEVAENLRKHHEFERSTGALDVMTELRRVAAESAPADTGHDGETTPRRGDAFEAWLKAQRDATNDPDDYWGADALLNRYRLHADTGTPLNEHVCEGRVIGDCECLETGPAAGLPAGGTQQKQENPRTVCVCGHTKGEHIAVSGRLLCDTCDPDSTDNLTCEGFDAL